MNGRSGWRIALGVFGVLALVLGAFGVGRAIPGGATRNAFTFAGTLRGTTGPQTLTFTFRKGAMSCTEEVTTTPATSTAAFSVELTLASCGERFFDGDNVLYDIAVGGTTLVTGASVTAVPYAKYADEVGIPDCPRGYRRDATATDRVLCKRGDDEMVRVGSGANTFWVDRYEATLWSRPNGTGDYISGRDAVPFPSTFPSHGDYTGEPLYAASVRGQLPSVNVTWYQARAACEASGKRLLDTAEWFAAVRGTDDPGASDGMGGACRTLVAGGTARATGAAAASCTSEWGAEDMIGNVAEIVEEIAFEPNVAGGSATPTGPEFRQDLVGVSPGGIYGATVRGGGALWGTSSGAYAAWVVGYGPYYGFRCAIGS